MGIVEKIVKQNLGVYRASPTRLQEDVMQEAQVAHDYRGRLAYELLQNADDAMEGAATGSDFVKFLLTDDALWMANTGRPLSEADVQGLCGLGASSKVDAKGVKRASIGHKGLGFKSVLEITNRPTAMSTDIAFELAEDHARGPVSKLWTDLGNEPPHSFPVMRFPALLTNPDETWTKLQRQGFSTAFKFPFRTEFGSRSREHLADLLLGLPLTTVLFLKHLDKVQVEVEMPGNSDIRTWSIRRRKQVPEGWVAVPGLTESGLYKVGVEASDGESAEFLLAHDSEVDIGLHRVGLSGPAWDGVSVSEVSVAVLDPDSPISEMPESWKRFHVFLPTAQPSPYPILVNGAFTTDLSRQAVRVTDDDADYNAHLIREAAALFRRTLVSELANRGLKHVLNVLERDRQAADEGAAMHLHAAIAKAVGSIPLLPMETGERITFSSAVLPPSLLGRRGTDYRAVLQPDAPWKGRQFPAPEYCTGRWSAVAGDHGAVELGPGESLEALAALCDPHRAAARDHESGGFEIDPVLEVCTALYNSSDSEERHEIRRTAQKERLFPIQREADGVLIRVAVDDETAFYPPRSARHDLPLSGLRFMAHSICWGALLPNERTQMLEDRMSTWTALFNIKEFRFEEVMRASVFPGLVLRPDDDALNLRESLANMETLTAICQLAGRQPKPDRPLRYQRLRSDRTLFNLSRLPVPCRRIDGSLEWVPAHRAYFGRDWIGAESVEDLVDTLAEVGSERSLDLPFLSSPDEFRGLLQDLAEDDEGATSSVDEDEDQEEVGLEEDLDASLESDEISAWISFLSWIGVNKALRPIHFHDVMDRDTGWLSTKDLQRPGGWAFENLGETWDEYRIAVLESDPRVNNEEVVPYFYELHDLEGIVDLLAAAENDGSGVIGAKLVEHFVRHWDMYDDFSLVTLALVKVGKEPARRSNPQRALSEELFEGGDNLWLHRLKSRGFFPTTHGPRRPGDVWFPSDEVQRRFGRLGQVAGDMLPLMDVDPHLPARQVREVAERLGVRLELSPSTFSIDDARLLCRRIKAIAKAVGPTNEQLRRIIRPAYRELFELLSGRSGDPDNRGALKKEPLLVQENAGYVFREAREVFYSRTSGFRQRSGVDGQLPSFVIEADSGATAPLTSLFGVQILEDSLTWIPDPGETPFVDEEEALVFRDGFKSLLPDLIARLRAERREPRDRRVLESFIERVEPVTSLEVTCSLNGKPLEVSAEREYFVQVTGGAATQAFVVWDGPAWPPGPDEAERLAMALADALEVNLVETFLAFVQGDQAQRLRLLDIAGASSHLEDVRGELLKEEAEPQGGSPDSGLDPTTSPLADQASKEEPAEMDMAVRPSAPRISLVEFDELSVFGEPILISGELGPIVDNDGEGGGTGGGGSSGHHVAAPGTDLKRLDELGMRIAMTYEVVRLRRLGAANPMVLETENASGPSTNLVVDVSTPAMIAAAEHASTVASSALHAMAQLGVSLLYPGFDILTLRNGEADRLIELKSSGVDARVQTMTWNEWKSARHSDLRHRFWLYLVGNLRADLPGTPYVRAINDPFGTLASDEVTEERLSRVVQLRVREFTEAEHLDLTSSKAVGSFRVEGE